MYLIRRLKSERTQDFVNGASFAIRSSVTSPHTIILNFTELENPYQEHYEIITRYPIKMQARAIMDAVQLLLRKCGNICVSNA